MSFKDYFRKKIDEVKLGNMFPVRKIPVDFKQWQYPKEHKTLPFNDHEISVIREIINRSEDTVYPVNIMVSKDKTTILLQWEEYMDPASGNSGALYKIDGGDKKYYWASFQRPEEMGWGQETDPERSTSKDDIKNYSFSPEKEDDILKLRKLIVIHARPGRNI